MSDKPFVIEPSARIARLPPYLFGRINKMKYEKRVAGIDIIDLGMGNPTDPTPEMRRRQTRRGGPRSAQPPLQRQQRHRRPAPGGGHANTSSKYGVELDPETEVIATIGSKEGFSHLCLALLGPGDTAIVPDPAFPIHIYAVAMAGAQCHPRAAGQRPGLSRPHRERHRGPVSHAQAADPELPAQPHGHDHRCRSSGNAPSPCAGGTAS